MGAFAPKKYIFLYIFCAWWLIRHAKNLIFYFNVRKLPCIMYSLLSRSTDAQHFVHLLVWIIN